jgi:Fe-S cluster biosynthesis and repair protein YggX
MTLVDNALACVQQPLVSTTSSKPRLADLAKQICAEHQAATAAHATTLEHAMAAGDLLIKAKRDVAPKHWKEWVERNCKMLERTERLYRQLAENRKTIEAEIDRQRVTGSGKLSVRGARKLISGPSSQSSSKRRVQTVVSAGARRAAAVLRRGRS